MGALRKLRPLAVELTVGTLSGERGEGAIFGAALTASRGDAVVFRDGRDLQTFCQRLATGLGISEVAAQMIVCPAATQVMVPWLLEDVQRDENGVTPPQLPPAPYPLAAGQMFSAARLCPAVKPKAPIDFVVREIADRGTPSGTTGFQESNASCVKSDRVPASAGVSFIDAAGTHSLMPPSTRYSSTFLLTLYANPPPPLL